MVFAQLDAYKLQEALEAVNVLVDTATIKFGPDGLRVETVDEANVGAVSMTIMSNAFNKYEGQEVDVSIDIHRFTRIIDKFAGDQSVRIAYEPSASQLDLSIGSYEFDLSLIHPDSVQTGKKAGEVNPPAKITVEAEPLQKAMRMADMFSNEVILGLDHERDRFYINARGDNDSMAVSYEESDDVVDEINTAPAHTIFGLSLLSRMVRIAPSNNSITLWLGKQYPIQMKYSIAGGNGRVEYGLAPRVQRE